MSLKKEQIKSLPTITLEMKERLKELVKNPYLLDQMRSGCCSFAAINMILLKYNEGDFLKNYIQRIINIKKDEKGKDFYSKTKERYEYFDVYKEAKDHPSPDQLHHIMDFFLNTGLITLFRERYEKSSDQRIWNANIEYTQAFGDYYTNKFKVIKDSGIGANPMTASKPPGTIISNVLKAAPQPLPRMTTSTAPNLASPGTSTTGLSPKFFLKKGDMANTWEGLQKAFEIAVEAGSAGKKTAVFQTVDIIDMSQAPPMGYNLTLISGAGYKKQYSRQVSKSRNWAREKMSKRFLIAGVFSGTESGSFARVKNWNHVNHYVVIPRAANFYRGTDFFASWGEKKHWDDKIIPLRILQVEIRDSAQKS